MAIALVAVPPKGGIYYFKVYLVWSLKGAIYGYHRPSPPLPLKGGRQMIGTSQSLVPTSSSLRWKEVILIISVSPFVATVIQQYSICTTHMCPHLE
jgi:hypothetical protein